MATSNEPKKVSSSAATTKDGKLKKDLPRGSGNPFWKGKSGNPTGRPKRTEEELDLIAACRKKAPEALEVMVHIMEHGENEKNQLAAAQAIIERGYGKATQPIDAEVNGAITVELVQF